MGFRNLHGELLGSLSLNATLSESILRSAEAYQVRTHVKLTFNRG